MSDRQLAGSACAQSGKAGKLRWAAGLAAAGALLALSGCGTSPPTSFYTLGGGGVSTPATATSAPSAAPLFIEVMPTLMPQQLQRTQLVLDTGPGQVDILEQRRWSQPLGDEITQALSQDLTGALPALDVYRTAHSPRQAVYRITVNVQRLSSVLGSSATLEAVWSVVRLPGDTPLTLTCRSAVSVPAGPGFDALIASHRQALSTMAQQIAAGVQALAQSPAGSNATRAPACPA